MENSAQHLTCAREMLVGRMGIENESANQVSSPLVLESIT